MYSSSGVWTESDLKDAALPKSRSRIFTSAVMKRQSEVITRRLAQPGLAAAEHDTRRATFLTATYVDTHTHAGDTRTHTHTIHGLPRKPVFPQLESWCPDTLQLVLRSQRHPRITLISLYTLICIFKVYIYFFYADHTVHRQVSLQSRAYICLDSIIHVNPLLLDNLICESPRGKTGLEKEGITVACPIFSLNPALIHPYITACSTEPLLVGV